MWFQGSRIEELELNDAVMNDHITAYPDEIELMQSTGRIDITKRFLPYYYKVIGEHLRK